MTEVQVVLVELSGILHDIVEGIVDAQPDMRVAADIPETDFGLVAARSRHGALLPRMLGCAIGGSSAGRDWLVYALLVAVTLAAAGAVAFWL